MRVYFDTGVFIDYMSVRPSASTLLRDAGRRGRAPQQVPLDAERLFEKVSEKHTGATAVLTCCEAEEALYQKLKASTKGVSYADILLIPGARDIAKQVLFAIEYFNFSILDLTSKVLRLQLQQLDLETHAIRAAGALHVSKRY